MQRDTDVGKIQSARTGTQKLPVSARADICLSRGTLHIVKVNKILQELFPEQLSQKTWCVMNGRWMDFSAQLGFMVVNVTGTLFVLVNRDWRLQVLLSHPAHRQILLLHTVVTPPWQILKHSSSDSSTHLLECSLENRAFMSCTALGSGNPAGYCRSGEGVLRLGYKNDDLHSFLQCCCGTGTWLKCCSCAPWETYFWAGCGWGSSVHAVNAVGDFSPFLFLTVVLHSCDVLLEKWTDDSVYIIFLPAFTLYIGSFFIF